MEAWGKDQEKTLYWVTLLKCTGIVMLGEVQLSVVQRLYRSKQRKCPVETPPAGETSILEMELSTQTYRD